MVQFAALADTVERRKRKSVAIDTAKSRPKRNRADRLEIGVAQNAEYDELSNRAVNLTEIDDPQIGVLEQEAVPFNEENIPPESRATVLSGINKEVATNFSL